MNGNDKTVDDVEIANLWDCVREIKNDIRTMKENHLSHIEKDMGVMSNDIDWLKRFFWVLVTSSLGAFLGAIITAIMQFV